MREGETEEADRTDAVGSSVELQPRRSAVDPQRPGAMGNSKAFSPDELHVVAAKSLAPKNATSADELSTEPADAKPDDDEVQDALDDEVEPSLTAGHSRHVQSMEVNESAAARSVSLGSAMMLASGTVPLVFLLLLISVAVYVNVIYDSASEQLRSQAAHCAINGSSRAAFSNASAERLSYATARADSLLAIAKVAVDTFLAQPHLYAAGAIRSSFQSEGVIWDDAVVFSNASSFSEIVLSNTTVLRSVAANFFFARSTRACADVWLSCLVVLSGGPEVVTARFFTSGCTNQWECHWCSWYDSSGAMVASYQLTAPTWRATRRSSPPISTCTSSPASTSALAAAAFHVAPSPDGPSSLVVLDGLLLPLSTVTLGSSIPVVVTTVIDTSQLHSVFRSGADEPIGPILGSTDSLLTANLEQLLVSAFLPSTDCVLFVRDATNASSVAGTAMATAAASVVTPVSSSLLPIQRSTESGYVWVDVIDTLEPQPPWNASATQMWNTTAIQLVLSFSAASVEVSLSQQYAGVGKMLDEGASHIAAASVVVVCVSFAAAAVYLWRVFRAGREIVEDIGALLNCLYFAKTMELEKAPVFGEGDAASPTEKPVSSPRNGVVGVKEHHENRETHEHGELSRGPTGRAVSPVASFLRQVQPMHGPRLPYSRVEEIRRAQEATNKMLESLREYRKFLPSSLFVRGELPMQDELAEELLQAIESPAGGSPRMSTISGKDADHAALSHHRVASQSAEFPRSTQQSVALDRLPSGVIKSTSRPQSSSNLHRAGSTITDSASPVSPRIVPVTSNSGFGAGSPMEHPTNTAVNLKRRKATILTVTFVGFLRMSQESVFEAHTASQTFLQIVLSVMDRNGGVVLHLFPDKVVGTWNCFKSDPSHEQHGVQCAHELSRTLQAADEEFLFSDHQVAISVISGNVIAGTSGTATERASVVEGRPVELGNDLLSLLVAISVRCAVSSSVAEHVSPPLWTVPLDVITDEENHVHEIHELRSGEEPPYVALMRKGFAEFREGNYLTAKVHYSEAVKLSVPRGIDPTALRLLKLCVMFSKLHTPYIRVTPCWQRFETDVPNDAASPDAASPKRRYRSEKRPSYVAEEQLRMELMTLRQASVLAPSPQRVRDREGADDGGSTSAQRTPRSPVASRSDTPPFQGLNVPFATERRSSQERRQSLERRASQERRLSGSLSPAVLVLSRRRSTPRGSAIDEQIARLGAAAVSAAAGQQTGTQKAATKANVVEFRDKKDMVYRMSDHVLGKGAVGEVYMGMSETGSLCAIKSVPLPSFAQAQHGPMNDVQKRRLKRKGINVSDNVERDVDALLNEVALLSRLRHENIVGYLSSAIVDKKILVVMEYISGGSLLNLLKDFRAVPLATARRYLRDVLRGLQYLHSEDIVHRDVKPQNVLLLIDGSCKLTDFGTCQRMSRLTGVASMEGTPQYMSPEASLGKAEKASDIWSFGILMAQLLTGELPWERDTNLVAMAFTYRLGHDDTMVPVIPESLPNDAKEIIRICCQRDAAARPTATQLLANPFFQLTAPTPMKSAKKRHDRSNRTPSQTRAPGPASPTTISSSNKRLSTALMKFSAFAEPTAACTPGSQSPNVAGIPDLVVHGPEDESGTYK